MKLWSTVSLDGKQTNQLTMQKLSHTTIHFVCFVCILGDSGRRTGHGDSGTPGWNETPFFLRRQNLEMRFARNELYSYEPPGTRKQFIRILAALLWCCGTETTLFIHLYDQSLRCCTKLLVCPQNLRCSTFHHNHRHRPNYGLQE